MKHAMELHQTLFSHLNILEKMGLVHETNPSMLPRRSTLVLIVGCRRMGENGMKMAICVASYSQLRQGCISCSYCSKRCFSQPSLVTRRSILALKVGVSWGW